MAEKPIKVLAVVCQMNRGGLESRLMDIIRHINYGQIQIDVFTYRKEQGIFDEEIKRLGGEIYYNPPLTIKNMFWYVGYFRDFLKQHKEYRIVHAHQDAWCSVFCKGAEEADVPVRIAHSRTAIHSLKLSDIAKNIIKLPTRKYATDYFAVSDKAAEWLFGKRLARSGKVMIWQNAIENKKYVFDQRVRERIRKELNIENKKVVIHVGNFTAPKNHEFLIEVFEKILQKEPNAVLILVGGRENRHIRQKAEEKKLEKRVFFLGSRKDVPDLLQAADVMVFPSKFEGLPGAVLEAQAAGLPCLLSDTITKEVEITPYIKWQSIKKNSFSEWAEEAIGLMEMKRTDTSEYFCKSGFDISVLVEKLESFYKERINE